MVYTWHTKIVDVLMSAMAASKVWRILLYDHRHCLVPWTWAVSGSLSLFIGNENVKLGYRLLCWPSAASDVWISNREYGALTLLYHFTSCLRFLSFTHCSFFFFNLHSVIIHTLYNSQLWSQNHSEPRTFSWLPKKLPKHITPHFPLVIPALGNH